MSENTKGLMRVVVTIGSRQYDEDLSAQLFLAPDLGGIDAALETGAARQGEWAMLAAAARTEHDKIKANIAIKETQIKDQEARAYLDAYNSGTKPPTVDAIKAYVQLDVTRLGLVGEKQKLEAELLAAADRLRVLEVGRDTLKDRKDYIIERARDAREEMKSRMSVRLPEGETIDRFKPGGR